MPTLLTLLLALGLAILVGRLAAQKRGRRPAGRARSRRTVEVQVEVTDDPRVAATGIVLAVAAMDAPITRAELAAMAEEAARLFETDGRETAQIVAAGRWEASRCPEPELALARLLPVVGAGAGSEALPDLEHMLRTVPCAGGATLSPEQEEMIAEVRRALSPAPRR